MPMRRLDLTLATPAENVALDEALLDWAESENPEWEFLRVWESTQPMVVVGRSTRVEQEVDREACRERGVPILRRSSGGAAIVAGPGCLMYAVVLSYKLRPEVKDIRRAHTFVLSRVADSINVAMREVGRVSIAGTSDLVFAPAAATLAYQAQEPKQLQKFSGNSLRARRTHVVYHGTLLYNFALPLMECVLLSPPRQPEYRAQRSHGEFVMNLPIGRTALLGALDRAWPTVGEVTDWPLERMQQLVADRFGRDAWNLEFP